MNTERSSFVFLLCVVVCIVVLFGLVYFEGYRLNLSSSLPNRLYRILPLASDDPLQTGDTVVIDVSEITDNRIVQEALERRYISPNRPMLKKIGAVPGDSVTLKDGLLYVDSESFPLSVASSDSEGRELLSYPTPTTISPDHYWLTSDPERGYDSRYFGPLPRSAFTHKAFPVF